MGIPRPCGREGTTGATALESNLAAAGKEGKQAREAAAAVIGAQAGQAEDRRARPGDR